MNYIELEIGGKKRGAKLGLGLLQKMQENMDINLAEIDEKSKKDAFTFIPNVLFHALAFNCERAGQEVDFDLYDVLDWCSDIGAYKEGSEVLKFWDAFTKSLSKQAPDSFIDKPTTDTKAQPAKKK
jgi:hypothetical protein